MGVLQHLLRMGQAEPAEAVKADHTPELTVMGALLHSLRTGQVSSAEMAKADCS